MIPGQHHIIKETSESIGELLKTQFKEIGYKRVHLVVAAPKQEAVEGKLPALSVYLYNITVDEEGLGNNKTGRYLDEEISADGKISEVARDMPIWLRLDYLISCWAQTPEEEQLLLGATVKALIENPVLRGEQLKGDAFGAEDTVPIYMQQKLDEGVLSRFWTSLNQPLKPALQIFTIVPVVSDRSVPIQRVVDREVRFFDLDKLNRLRR